ncbi:MAG: helix-turn-helix transcriptional regulator [Alphaproteobacteria bacterium]|nr:helix-turn-helix transcriptional regulator [Alphaproteobacteria bacterium]
MSTFGQFCPIALASEILTQKWMLLIVRELNAGSKRFNDIRRGVPRISATLLKQRLDQLELAGALIKKPMDNGAGDEYLLTDAGRELKNILGAIGEWGQRWARDISPEDLDPGWLVWAMHRRIDTSRMPKGRTVLEIEFTDAPKSQRFFWLLCHKDNVDVCIKPPGYDTDLTIKTDVLTLAKVWRGIGELKKEISCGHITLEGKNDLKKQFPNWLLLSIFAKIKKQK